ncbi:MAG: hypothetical protein ABI609_00005, partial [Acidobacteriota bacterium]
MATKRTTMRSRAGKKLYAVRNSGGKFKDIQTYKRAHSADMKRKSKAELAKKKAPKKAAKKVAKKVVKKVVKKVAKKVVKKAPKK